MRSGVRGQNKNGVLEFITFQLWANCRDFRIPRLGPKRDPFYVAFESAPPHSSSFRVKGMTLFAVLRKFRDLERRHLPFARSLIDYDLIIEIGYHEERGKPLTLKHLKTMGICARTTLHRRLNGLVQAGVIVKSRGNSDGRAVMLGVAKPAAQRFERFRHAFATSVIHLF